MRSRLYGLVLKDHTAFALGEPESQPSTQPADIELIEGASPDFREGQQALAGHRHRRIPWIQHARLPNGSDYVRWPRLGEFLITAGGRRILSRPHASCSRETIQTYALTQVLSFALLRRGIEPLHATVIVMHGKAVALLGDSGYGKSTLAAACVAAGFPILTDDLLVLKQREGQFLAYPGPARLKLMPAVARAVFGAHTAGARMHAFTSKLIIPLTHAHHVNHPVPLAAFYSLRSPGAGRLSRVRIRSLTPRAAWLALTKGTFNLMAKDPERSANLFAWMCRLIDHLPVKSFGYPRSLATLPHVVDALAADVEKLQ